MITLQICAVIITLGVLMIDKVLRSIAKSTKRMVELLEQRINE